MAFNVSYIIEAVDRFSAASKKIVQSAEALQYAMLNLSMKTKAAGQAMQKLGASMLAMGSKVRQFGQSMTVYASLPIIGIGMAAIKASAKLETLRTKLNVMVGSKEKGKALFDQLINFEQYTPFSLAQWLPAQNMLLSSGVKSKDLVHRMQQLGDLAAGSASATGGAPDLLPVVAAYREIQASGIMQKRDLLKFTRKGLAVPTALEAVIHLKDPGSTKAYQQLLKIMAKGKITADMFNAAMDKMTSKGGQYAGMMTTLAQTTQGLWTTMQTGILRASAALGDIIIDSEDLKNVMRATTKFLNDFANKAPAFAKTHRIWIQIGLAALLFIAVLGPIALILGSIISILGVLGTVAGFAFTIIGGVIELFVLSPLGLIIVAVGAVIGAVLALKDAFPTAFQTGLDWCNRLLTVIGKIAGLLIYLPTLLMTLDFSGISNRVKGISASIDAFNGKPPITANQANNGSINGTINVNAPPGVVKSVEGSSKGSVGNLGMNLFTVPGPGGSR